jgi:hypothetical protein
LCQTRPGKTSLKAPVCCSVGCAKLKNLTGLQKFKENCQENDKTLNFAKYYNGG